MKKIIAIITLVLVMVSNIQVVHAYDAGTIAINGKNARTVTVTMSEGAKVLLTTTNNTVTDDMKFTNHIEAAEAVFGTKPSVSVNGTFFNAYYKGEKSYPDNCPIIYQTLVDNGEVIIGGGEGYAATIGFTKDGKALIDYVEIQAKLTVGGRELYPWGINSYHDNDYAVLYYTERIGYPITAADNATAYFIKDGKIVSKNKGGTYTINSGEALLIIMPKYSVSYSVGDTVKQSMTVKAKYGDSSDWQNINIAVACNPMLLANGNVVTTETNTDTGKLQNDFVAGRTFAAIDANNHLTFGIVTASPNQIAEALKQNGYTYAMLLDGGGSSALASASNMYSNPGRLLTNVIHILEADRVVEVPEIPFTDISKNDVFYDAVKWAYDNKITSGTSAKTFSPKNTCTRGEVVTFLWRTAGCPEPTNKDNPFTDVASTDYYYKPILWAVEKGITSGTSATTFSPKTTCEYSHIITFIWRYMGSPEASNEGASWFDEAMSWASEMHLCDNFKAESSVVTDGVSRKYDVHPYTACPRSSVVELLYKCTK